MRKMIAFMMSAVMAVGIFSTTALAYTGDANNDKTAETSVTAVDSATDDVDSEMQVVPDGYSIKTNDDGSMTVTVGGKEYTVGGDSDTEQIGTVVSGINSLNFRTGPGMEYDVIGYLLPGEQVDVLGQSGSWYQVSHGGTTGYVYGSYLNVMDTSGNSNDDMMMLLAALLAANNQTSDNTGESLTPDGNLTLVDDIGSDTGEGQQFITLVTKAGNTFYMVIDRNDDGEDNVHFMNLVDETDLLALMDEDEAAKYEAQTVPAEENTVTPTPDPNAGDDAEDSEDTEKREAESNGASKLPLIMLLLFVIGAAGVGGYLYIKMKGGRPASKTEKPDPDADYRDEDEIELQEESEDSDASDSYDEEIDEDYDSETGDEPV